MNKQDNIAIFTQVDGIQYNCVLTMKGVVIHTVLASEYECITVCDETFGARNWIRIDKEEKE
jgi:hypothetical protein